MRAFGAISVALEATEWCRPDRWRASDLTMKRLAYKVRVALAGLLAVGRGLLRRARHGPTLPSWTLSEELLVAVSRATARASARNIELMAPRGSGLRVPLDAAARTALTVEEVDLNGVRAERYRPKAGTSGTILYFHGGGFVSGGVGLERRPAAANAIASNCDTFSIDYRLAPKHPYPAALDDAIAAYQAVLERGADPETCVLFGASAGACLALSSLLKLRNLGLPQPAGAVLLWPYADFTFSGETIVTNAEVDTLPLRDLAPIWGPAYIATPTQPTRSESKK